MHWPRVTRDGLMFVLGAVGFMHEVFVSGPTEHPFLLAASAALMGLPFIFPGPSDGRPPTLSPQRRYRRDDPPRDDDGADWEETDPGNAGTTLPPLRRPRLPRRLERDSEEDSQ